MSIQSQEYLLVGSLGFWSRNTVEENCGGGVRGGWGAEGMTGGAQLSVEKMEAQFTQSAGVETHIWVSKI